MCFECVSKYIQKGVLKMDNLKCRKQGFNKLICKRTNEQITFDDCKNCRQKEYKSYKPLKQKTSKQAKLEKNRFSLFTDDLSKCYFCGKPKNDIHEIFGGRNRTTSMKYGLCLPICRSCHIKYQNDPLFNEIWHIKGQN